MNRLGISSTTRATLRRSVSKFFWQTVLERVSHRSAVSFRKHIPGSQGNDHESSDCPIRGYEWVCGMDDERCIPYSNDFAHTGTHRSNKSYTCPAGNPAQQTISCTRHISKSLEVVDYRYSLASQVVLGSCSFACIRTELAP